MSEEMRKLLRLLLGFFIGCCVSWMAFDMSLLEAVILFSNQSMIVVFTYLVFVSPKEKVEKYAQALKEISQAKEIEVCRCKEELGKTYQGYTFKMIQEVAKEALGDEC